MGLSRILKGGLESLVNVFSKKEDPFPNESPENVANKIRMDIDKIKKVYNERAIGEESSSNPTKVYKEIEESLYSLKCKDKSLYNRWKREYNKIK